MNTTVSSHTSTFHSIYSYGFIVILLIAVFLGSSASEYENKQQQYYAYATTITTITTTTTTTTTTTAATLPSFNFAAAGDWGCTDDTTNTVNNILDKNPELVLGLGDYSYDEDPADCWLKKV